MKPSHYQSPRTLQDAVFYTNADPITDFGKPPFDYLGLIAVVVVFGTIGTLLAITL